ncbi:hypothetical protein K7X08_000675 [Anisodus acutangulus]|uniref:Pentatricopeptide repeat-containing protein n=1 Tax=Anisodus acutangulus TaxID=402998 RepID=A0A9Q1REA1_9SOLA|nr:hypothetical protein K7X08_000675 [Anisodus acutangulus]
MIHFLVSCGLLEDEYKLFDESSVRDLVFWNSLSNGYVRSGTPREALNVFEKMEMEFVEPDEVTIIGLVGACAQLENLELGRKLHSYFMDKCLCFSVPLCNAFMDMYMKNGSVNEAKALFDRMDERTMRNMRKSCWSLVAISRPWERLNPLLCSAEREEEFAGSG